MVGGVFSASSLGRAFPIPSTIKLSQDAVVPESEDLGPLPFVIVVGDAVPLQWHIMRPFPEKSASPGQDAYNYRHSDVSRSRRVVENGCGILSRKDGGFIKTKLPMKPETMRTIPMATTILHIMFLRHQNRVADISEVGDPFQEYTSLPSVTFIGKVNG